MTSREDEARNLLANVLRVAVKKKSHFYAGAFESDNPHCLPSLFGLDGLTTKRVFEIAGFCRRRGASLEFAPKNFEKWIQCFQTDSLRNVVEPLPLTRELFLESKRLHVYRVGVKGHDSPATMKMQAQAQVLAPVVDHSTEPHVALRRFAESIVVGASEGNSDAAQVLQSSAKPPKEVSTRSDAQPLNPNRGDEEEASERPARKCIGVTHSGLQSNASKSPECIRALQQKGFFLKNNRWHHRDCTTDVPPERTSSACEACGVKWKNTIRRKLLEKHPECSIIFEGAQESTLQVPVVTEAMVRDRISNVCTVCVLKSVTELPGNKGAGEIVHLLQAARLSSCEVNWQDKRYHVSYCVECTGNGVTPVLVVRQSKATSVCDSCYNLTKNRKRRERNAENADEQVQPNSRTTFRALKMSPDAKRMKARISNMVSEMRLLRGKLSRSQRTFNEICLQDDEVEVVAVHEGDDERKADPITAIVSKLKEILEKEKSKSDAEREDAERARNQMILALLNARRKRGEEEFSMADAASFVTDTIDQVNNYALRLRGKAKQIRYSPKALKIAMGIFMRSRAAHEELLAEGWIVSLPSITTLLRLRKELRVKDGRSVPLYVRAVGSKPLGSKSVGHLLCDETKLTCNTQWNTHSKETAGFVTNSSGGDLDSMLREVMTGTKRRQTAIEVNQWKYRSSTNESFECEFFFNGGDLDSGMLLTQFMHVMNSLEMSNCMVEGFSTDGNSVNVVAMKILSALKSEPADHSCWLDPDYVSMPHPCDGSGKRKLFFWLCSTHMQKSLRNGLLASRPSGKRDFCNVKGVSFGCKGQAELKPFDCADLGCH